MCTRASEEVLLAPELCHRFARFYLGDGVDPRTPLASPLFADLRGLPPLLIHVGTHELLLDDARRFTAAARGAAVEVTLVEWDELWHVFQMFVSMPEARRALAELGGFVRAHARAPAAALDEAEPAWSLLP